MLKNGWTRLKQTKYLPPVILEFWTDIIMNLGTGRTIFMAKSKTIKLSLVLSVFSLFIFSFTYFGSSAFGSRSSSSLEFSEQTFIGSFDVSRKSHEAVKSELVEKMSEWA